MSEREKLIDLLDTVLFDNICDFCGESGDVGKRNVIEKTADYLLENGVIIPPVKVGDTIYEIHERRKGNEWVKIISERVVHGVEIGVGGCIIARCGTTVSVFLSELGETVFLTREEAEKALKEREQK